MIASAGTISYSQRLSEPQGGPNPSRACPAGRPSLVSIPDVRITPAWQDSWLGFELSMRSLGRRPGTIINRRSGWSSVARHAIADGLPDPATVTKSWLQRYMLRQITDRRNTGASNHYQCIKCFWDWYAAEYDKPNPMAGIPAPRGSAPPPPVMSSQQLSNVLGACGGKSREAVRNRALVLLLLESGLRRMEVAALCISDIDVRARTVVVRRGKGGKARISVFGDETAQALHRWLRIRGTAGEPLFTNCRGGRLTTSGIGQVLYRIGDKAGVPGLRAHLFWHAWTHFLLTDGIREHDIMKLAGWSSTRQLDCYGAALAEQRAIASGLNHQVARIVRGGS